MTVVVVTIPLIVVVAVVAVITTAPVVTSAAIVSKEYIAGQRCMILRRHRSFIQQQQQNQQQKQQQQQNAVTSIAVSTDERITKRTNNNIPNIVPIQQQQQSKRPLVVCIGMAQTIDIWEHHIIPLSQNYQRDVLLYQPSGLGLINNNNDDDDDGHHQILSNVSIPYQAEQLIKTIHTAFNNNNNDDNENNKSNNGNCLIQDDCVCNTTTVDLVGYSLGGRIAMAVACIQPELIQSLHLTGVGLYRTDTSYMQLYSWTKHLQHNNIQSFAIAALVATYSSTFLRQHEHKIQQWIDSISNSHTCDGLLSLLVQTSDDDDNDNLWSVRQMAYRLKQQQQQQQQQQENIQIQLLVGEYDIISPIQQAQDLATYLDTKCIVIDKCGHCVPMESSRIWRQFVLQFLSQNQ